MVIKKKNYPPHIKLLLLLSESVKKNKFSSLVIKSGTSSFLSLEIITSELVSQTHQQRILNTTTKTISVLNVSLTYVNATDIFYNLLALWKLNSGSYC